ncbi:MAG: hypothetical protein Q7S69_04350 [Nitrosomonadaceae bacterium]|nr:hypothetical protein [Nitrosomonadaceae bacterium]
MASHPDWLPPMFVMSPWNETVMESLYTLFRRDFIEHPANYRGVEVWFFPEKDRGKELIFWHLVERGDTGERFPDFRRAERLPWARAMLDHLDAPEILDWDFEEGDGSVHTYVWLKDFDYLIVMKKYRDGRRRLITAYHINYENARRKLLKKFERRLVHK